MSPNAREEPLAPLFDQAQAANLRDRWKDLQVAFVDQPREAVQEADALVASTIKQLSETFAAERKKLEQAWGQGEEVTTEDLRLALRLYRSLFNRLLAV